MNPVIWGLILFSGLIVSPVILPVIQQEPLEEPVLLLQSREIPTDIYDADTNTIFSPQFDLKHRPDGALVIKQDGEKLGGLMFAVTGTVNGQNLTRFSDDFDWTWNVRSEDINVLGETKQKYFLDGNNNNSQFLIEQFWGPFYAANDPKVTYKITNNFQRITNAKFWFVQVLKPNDQIKFNGVERFLQENGSVHLKEADGVNLADKLIRINNKLDFDFEDLNANGFTVTDIYLGKGNIIERPNLTVVAVGVTKNGGVFPVGRSVELDPTIQSTSIVFFTKTANNNGVVNPSCLLKGIVPPKGCYADFGLNDSVDLNTPVAFGWPFPLGDINVTGITIQIQAKAVGGFCPTPSPTGTISVKLSGNAGDTFTSTKSDVWDCNEGDKQVEFGGETDNWGVLWDEDNNLSTDKFVLNIEQTGITGAGPFSPGVGFAKVQVHYTEQCVYPGSGDYDCNCNGGYIPDINNFYNIGANDLVISNSDGNGTLEIYDRIVGIDNIHIDRSCQVTLIRDKGKLEALS